MVEINLSVTVSNLKDMNIPNKRKHIWITKNPSGPKYLHMLSLRNGFQIKVNK